MDTKNIINEYIRINEYDYLTPVSDFIASLCGKDNIETIRVSARELVTTNVALLHDIINRLKEREAKYNIDEIDEDTPEYDMYYLLKNEISSLEQVVQCFKSYDSASPSIYDAKSYRKALKVVIPRNIVKLFSEPLFNIIIYTKENIIFNAVINKKLYFITVPRNGG